MIKKKLFLIHLGAVDVKVRCDDSVFVYIDGNEVGRTSDSQTVWSQEVAARVRIIAIYCYNFVGDAGLLVSFSNGLTSDSTWRCTHDNVGGWYEEAFDDSDWDRAYVIQPNDGSGERWLKDNRFPDNAKWIWGSSDMAGYPVSYCRGKTSELTT